MSIENLSALISLIVSIMLLLSNFTQWYDATWDGKNKIRTWAKFFLAACLMANLISGYLLFKS